MFLSNACKVFVGFRVDGSLLPFSCKLFIKHRISIFLSESTEMLAALGLSSIVFGIY
jgi:hypothetical protein